MKRYEQREKKLFEALKQAAPSLGWNVDVSFAKLLLPVIKEYKKKSFEVIDFEYMNLRFIDQILVSIFSKIGLKKFEKIIRKANGLRWKKHIEDLEAALEDVLIEDTAEWEKYWHLKEMYPVEYDQIPEIINNQKMFSLQVKKEFVENQKKNVKIIKYNIKQELKCYKWRDKQFRWFIDHMRYLWW